MSATPGTWDVWRVLASVLLPFVVMVLAFRRRSLDRSGTVAGYLVGAILASGSYCFLVMLLVFFITSTKATKYRAEEKRTFEADYKEGGQRTWVQVFCNGGVAAGWALGYLALRGPGERAVDFSADPLGSWLVLAVLSAVASACGDTWASELGSVASPAAPRLLTTLRPVPRGTNGGVSVAGLVFSALGGLTIGVSHYVVLCLAGVGGASHWWLVALGTLGGLLGSLVDSLLGATLQFTGQVHRNWQLVSPPLQSALSLLRCLFHVKGVETKTGRVVDRPGPGVRWVCGRALLDNHAVNLVSSAITSVLVPSLVATLCS